MPDSDKFWQCLGANQKVDSYYYSNTGHNHVGDTKISNNATPIQCSVSPPTEKKQNTEFMILKIIIHYRIIIITGRNDMYMYCIWLYTCTCSLTYSPH